MRFQKQGTSKDWVKQSSGSHFVVGGDPEKGFPRKSLSGARCVLTFPEQVVATELVLGNTYMPLAGEGFLLCISLLHPCNALKITLLQDFRRYPPGCPLYFSVLCTDLDDYKASKYVFHRKEKRKGARKAKVVKTAYNLHNFLFVGPSDFQVWSRLLERLAHSLNTRTTRNSRSYIPSSYVVNISDYPLVKQEP